MKRLPYAFSVLALFATAASANDPQPASQIPPSDSKPGARPANNPATTPPPAGSMEFGKVDKNGDGSLNQSEFDGAGMQGMTLAQVDMNKDGKISNDEWSSHQAKMKNPNR
jgi:hypothetical protein